MHHSRVLLAGLVLAFASPAAAEVRLVMAEQHGCIFCERWDREISPAYCKTPIGQAAPLQRYNIREEEVPVELERRVIFTPTFILARDGQELSRLEGYSGDEFFWVLIERMLTEAEVDLAEEAGDPAAECLLEATGEAPLLSDNTAEAPEGAGDTSEEGDTR